LLPPPIEDVIKEIKFLPNHIALDANKIAADLGLRRSANMVILGAASPYLDLEFTDLEKAVTSIFKSKGEDVIQANIKALNTGREFAKNYIKN
jgi:indolepyruvate ferredoxin oxidoreductase beta subunit